MSEIVNGIVIGGAGGAIAGITVSVIHFSTMKVRELRDRKTVRSWLKENTSEAAGEQFRSTRAIASWTNLTQDRVRYVCSMDDKVFLSTGAKDDMWGLFAHTPRSVYEERGLRSV